MTFLQCPLYSSYSFAIDRYTSPYTPIFKESNL